ncbi:MAG TPA: sugar ABC transporter permease [Clostridiales bacterium]|nr:sugar ABC transporter permease [Clostridiales bacterium]
MQNQKKLSYKIWTFLSFGGVSIVLFSAVVIVPFIFGLYLTFTGWDGISGSIPFIGMENYLTLLKDTEFWISLGRTVIYALFSVLLANMVAFALAYLVTGNVKGRNVYRVAFFTPNLIGGIVLGYIWQFVFNRAILMVGEATGIELFSSSWLSDPTKAFWALVIVTVWQQSGYLMLIYIAGLMGIPEDLKEAARIDGCNERKAMRHITLPMMVGTFTICFFLAITRSFVIYDVNISLTNGGPYNTTRLAAMYVYNMAFSSKKYGVGQAEALILFVVIAVIAVSQALLGKKKEVEA